MKELVLKNDYYKFEVAVGAESDYGRYVVVEWKSPAGATLQTSAPLTNITLNIATGLEVECDCPDNTFASTNNVAIQVFGMPDSCQLTVTLLFGGKFFFCALSQIVLQSKTEIIILSQS